MKKILALILSVVMMFAVCVPAFAEYLPNASGNWIVNDTQPEVIDGKQKVQTNISTTTEKQDGTNGASYTVTIPATITIPWEKTSHTFTYNIKTQLEAGKRLAISAVSASGEKELVDEAGNKLPYIFTKTVGDENTSVENLSYTTTKEVVELPRTFNIDIAEADWKNVPVNVYTGQLTFEVSIVDA